MTAKNAEKAEKDPLFLQRPGFDWANIVLNIFLPVVGVLVALLIGALMLIVLKADLIAAYAAMVDGAVGSASGITQSLVKATPLLLVGLRPVTSS